MIKKINENPENKAIPSYIQILKRLQFNEKKYVLIPDHISSQKSFRSYNNKIFKDGNPSLIKYSDYNNPILNENENI